MSVMLHDRQEAEPLVKGYPGCAPELWPSPVCIADRKHSHFLAIREHPCLIHPLGLQRSADYKRFKDFSEAMGYAYGR